MEALKSVVYFLFPPCRWQHWDQLFTFCFLPVDGSTEVGFVRNSTRQYLLQVLLRSLDQPAPNLAHLLLGFDIRKSVAKTLLQDPGEKRFLHVD